MSDVPARLGLARHPEGGWFRQTWTSPESVTLPDGRTRPTATLIHFWLPAGEATQAVVPAGVWRRTLPGESDALVSCLVSPGFDFDDVELAPLDP